MERKWFANMLCQVRALTLESLKLKASTGTQASRHESILTHFPNSPPVSPLPLGLDVPPRKLLFRLQVPAELEQCCQGLPRSGGSAGHHPK